MLAFDHSTVEEVEKTLSQKGLECFRVHPELEFLAAAEPEKKKACLRTGSKQLNIFELKNEFPFLARTVHYTLPMCCLPITMAQLRRGQISVQSTLDVQEGPDARTGEGWVDARDVL